MTQDPFLVTHMQAKGLDNELKTLAAENARMSVGIANLVEWIEQRSGPGDMWARELIHGMVKDIPAVANAYTKLKAPNAEQVDPSTVARWVNWVTARILMRTDGQAGSIEWLEQQLGPRPLSDNFGGRNVLRQLVQGHLEAELGRPPLSTDRGQFFKFPRDCQRALMALRDICPNVDDDSLVDVPVIVEIDRNEVTFDALEWLANTTPARVQALADDPRSEAPVEDMKRSPAVATGIVLDTLENGLDPDARSKLKKLIRLGNAKLEGMNERSQGRSELYASIRVDTSALTRYVACDNSVADQLSGATLRQLGLVAAPARERG